MSVLDFPRLRKELESHVLARTGTRVSNLGIELSPEGIRLLGQTATYHVKQLAQHSVRGAKVHDTRLVAAMNVHSVRSLLTFNSDDFVRFGIEVLHPTSVGP